MEDLGYGVNYGAADAFTAADLNPTCVCSAAAGVRKPGGVFKIGGTAGFDPSKFAGGKYSRGRLGGPRGSKPRLSTLGRRIAWRRGKQHLQALHEKKTQAVSNGSSGGSPDGSVFFGDRVVNVLYQERGHIYNVRVTASNKV